METTAPTVVPSESMTSLTMLSPAGLGEDKLPAKPPLVPVNEPREEPGVTVAAGWEEVEVLDCEVDEDLAVDLDDAVVTELTSFAGAGASPPFVPVREPRVPEVAWAVCEEALAVDEEEALELLASF